MRLPSVAHRGPVLAALGSPPIDPGDGVAQDRLIAAEAAAAGREDEAAALQFGPGFGGNAAFQLDRADALGGLALLESTPVRPTWTTMSRMREVLRSGGYL